MSKPNLPSTRELGRRYRRLLQLAQTEDVLDYGRFVQVLNHWESEENGHPVNERGQGRLSIPPNIALRFVDASLRGFRVQPDIYFGLAWSAGQPDDPFDEFDLKVRVWIPGTASARPLLDHVDLTAYDWRVGLRVHFDRHTAGQRTPRYHFQAGGKPEVGELCQLYEEICEPRVPTWPIDFALAVQMILRGFFPVSYSRLILKDEFRAIIRQSEQQFIKPFQVWVARYLSGNGLSVHTARPPVTMLDYLNG